MESRIFSGAVPIGPRHFSCGATGSREHLVRLGTLFITAIGQLIRVRHDPSRLG